MNDLKDRTGMKCLTLNSEHFVSLAVHVTGM